MGILLLLFVMFVISPMVTRIMYINPLLGILCYILMISAYVSYLKHKRAKMFGGQQYHQRTYTNASSQYHNQSASSNTEQGQQAKQKDVIDVEYTQQDM